MDRLGRKEGRNKEKEVSRAALTRRIKDYSGRIDIVTSENARLGIKKKGRRENT